MHPGRGDDRRGLVHARSAGSVVSGHDHRRRPFRRGQEQAAATSASTSRSPCSGTCSRRPSTTAAACGSSPTTRRRSVAAAACGVEVVADPGGGQGAAVAAALRGLDGVCSRRQRRRAAHPPIRPDRARLRAARGRGRASSRQPTARRTRSDCRIAEVFQPLYGPGSAARFRAHAVALGLFLHDLDLPNLRDDVDTAEDLERLGPRGRPANARPDRRSSREGRPPLRRRRRRQARRRAATTPSRRAS